MIFNGLMSNNGCMSLNEAELVNLKPTRNVSFTFRACSDACGNLEAAFGEQDNVDSTHFYIFCLSDNLQCGLKHILPVVTLLMGAILNNLQIMSPMMMKMMLK